MNSTAQEGASCYSVGRVRRSLRHFIAGRGLTSIASFAVAILLVRMMPVSDYAGYTALSGLLMTMMVVSNGGIERVVPRYFPELRLKGANDELRHFCWQLTRFRLLFLLAALVLLAMVFPYACRWLGIPDQPLMYWAFFCYALSYGMSMHFNRAMQSLMLQRRATIAMAIEWFPKFAIVGLWFVFFNTISLVKAVWIQGGTAALGIIYMLYQLNRHLPLSEDAGIPQDVLDYGQVRRMGTHNYLQSLAGFHADPAVSKIFSSYFLPEATTAALGFAHSIAGVLRRYLPATLLLGLIEPTIMAKHSESNDFAKTTHLAGIVFKVNLFILVPMAVFVFVSGQPLVEVMTGGKYGDSAWIISILLLVLMMESHRLVLQLIVNAVEKSELLLTSNLWSLFFVPVTVAAISIFGIKGLMSGVLAISFSRNFYLVNRLRKLGLPYSPDWYGVAKIAILAAVAVISAKTFVANEMSPVPESLVTGAIAAIFFLLFAFVWKPFSQKERETLNRFLGRPCFVW